MKMKKKKGFSMVEILVVLTVVTILSMSAMLVVPKQFQRSRDAVRKANLDSFKKAIAEYYTDKGCYPNSVPSCGNAFVVGSATLRDSIPCDPKTNLSYSYISDSSSSCPKWFQIYANLEIEDDKAIASAGCLNGCGPTCNYNYGVASTNQTLNPYCSGAADVGADLGNMGDTPPGLPQAGVQQFVCTPSGGCEVYTDPYISGCPNIYPDDSTCGGSTNCADIANRCDNTSGK